MEAEMEVAKVVAREEAKRAGVKEVSTAARPAAKSEAVEGR
jgi:hypothetical protein